jgi:hypothetical protein
MNIGYLLSRDAPLWHKRRLDQVFQFHAKGGAEFFKLGKHPLLLRIPLNLPTLPFSVSVIESRRIEGRKIMIRSIKTLAGLMLIVGLLTALFGPTVLALVPANPPEPAYIEGPADAIEVNGMPDDWDMVLDFFLLWGPGGRIHFRYNCSTQTLYMLVFTEQESPVQADPEEAVVEIGGIRLDSEFAWVDPGYPYSGPSPPTSDYARGWEASAELVPGTYIGIFRTGVWIPFEGWAWTEVPFDLVIQCAPTAVTLASFDAAPSQGTVALNWETATEVDTAGFNLYRARSESGAWTKVNDKLIAATGDFVSGASYSYVDKPGYGAFLYELEEVDYDGTATLYDLIIVRVAPLFRRPLRRPIPPQVR